MLALAPAEYLTQHISTCLHWKFTQWGVTWSTIFKRDKTRKQRNTYNKIAQIFSLDPSLTRTVFWKSNTTWQPLIRVARSDASYEQKTLTTWSEWLQQQVPLSPALWCASCPVDKELPPWSRVDTWMATLGRVTGPRETWKPCSFPKWTSIRELREKEYFGWKYLFKT